MTLGALLLAGVRTRVAPGKRPDGASQRACARWLAASCGVSVPRARSWLADARPVSVASLALIGTALDWSQATQRRAIELASVAPKARRGAP